MGGAADFSKRLLKSAARNAILNVWTRPLSFAEREMRFQQG